VHNMRMLCLKKRLKIINHSFRIKFIIMRLITIILTVASLHTSVSAFSQININVKSASIENVLKQIKKQSGYAIFYDAAYLSNAKPVTVNLNDASLEESLKQSFAGQTFTYEILAKTIIIKPAAANVVQQTTITGKVTDEHGDP